MKKKLMTLLLAAALCFGASMFSDASAVEMKTSGQFDFAFGWVDRNLSAGKGTDKFEAVQRFRPEFRFIADENVQAVLQLEIGKTNWGYKDGGLGSDGKTVKVRYAYLDWNVPGVDAKVRMGLQNVLLPNYTGLNNMVGLDDTAAISTNWQIMDKLGMNLFWARPYNSSVNQVHDAIDAIGLAFEWKDDGWKIAPWGMYAHVGSEVDFSKIQDDVENGSWIARGLLPASSFVPFGEKLPHDGNVWWVGLSGELTYFDPFRVAFDWSYGHAAFGTMNGINQKRAGWMAQLLAQYKMDYLTPGIALWYASGDDSNYKNGSERLPYFYQDVVGLGNMFDSGFGISQGMFAQTLDGTWGIQLRADDISFIDKLSHDVRVAWIKGTNNTAMAPYVMNVDSLNYLTTSDDAWLFNVNTKYEIYKNLTAGLDLSMMKVNYADKTWKGIRDNSYDDTMFAATVRMTYKF